MKNRHYAQLFYDVLDDPFKLNHLIKTSLEDKNYSFERVQILNHVTTSLILNVGSNCFIGFERIFNMKDQNSVNGPNFTCIGYCQKRNKAIDLHRFLSEESRKLLNKSLKKENIKANEESVIIKKVKEALRFSKYT